VAGRSYVAYGIGPSLLMLPLVALWGPGFNQAAFNAALGGLAVALWWSITGLLSFDYWKRLWLTALFAVGALFCFAAGQSGSTWNLMHVTTVRADVRDSRLSSAAVVDGLPGWASASPYHRASPLSSRCRFSQ
jgi:hypothetical protein